MLLPALGKAREKARQIHCTNNLKQWGLTFKMNIGDYNDSYPPFGVSNAYTYNWAWRMANQKYIDTRSLYYCPANGELDRDYSRPNGTQGLMAFGASSWFSDARYNSVNYRYINYGYNWTWVGSNAWNSSLTFSSTITAAMQSPTLMEGAISHASETILLGESIGKNDTKSFYVIGPNDSNNLYVLHGRHNKSSNVLKLDGHVESYTDVTQRVFYADSVGDGKSFWNPR